MKGDGGLNMNSLTHIIISFFTVLGQANMYANLQVPGPEPKVKDGTGKEWDMVTPSAFHFEYVKDSEAKHDGVRLKSTRIFADSGPAMMMMLKRGQVKAADLGL